jgi:hypothetical protein
MPDPLKGLENAQPCGAKIPDPKKYFDLICLGNPNGQIHSVHSFSIGSRLKVDG